VPWASPPVQVVVTINDGVAALERVMEQRHPTGTIAATAGALEAHAQEDEIAERQSTIGAFTRVGGFDFLGAVL
jgi:hypothetical protein